MSKMDQTGINADWYELWMKQSQEFFETANKNLKDLFEKNTQVNPEDHLTQINEWLENLRKQWAFTQLTDEQKIYQAYWNTMNQLCKDASDLMLTQWTKRTQNGQPVKSIRELYELWLNCCHDVYQQNMRTASYQDAYAKLMNATFDFWKTVTPK